MGEERGQCDSAMLLFARLCKLENREWLSCNDIVVLMHVNSEAIRKGADIVARTA